MEKSLLNFEAKECFASRAKQHAEQVTKRVKKRIEKWGK